MNMDGGTWEVGNVVTNTVERQEMTIITTDYITDQTGEVLSFESTKALAGFTGGTAVKQNSPLTPVTTAITGIDTLSTVTYRYIPETPGSTGSSFTAQNTTWASGQDETTANLGVAPSPGISTCWVQMWKFDYPARAFFYNTGQASIAASLWRSSDGINWVYDSTSETNQSIGPAASLGTSTYWMAFRNAPEDQWNFSTQIMAPAGYYVTNGGITQTILTFTDNTQLDNFQSGDVLQVTNPGTVVIGSTPATSQMTVDGGTWSNGQTVTGPLIDGTGNVVSTDVQAQTMTLDAGRFAIGTKVQSVNPVPNPEVQMYCVMNANGQISDLASTDPGYTNMDSTSLSQVFTFPPVFPTGETPDEALPTGTTVVADVKAENSSGQSTATTNVVTPT